MRPKALTGSADQGHEALIARGGLARTFGSLAGFLALTLLAAGLYLIDDAWVHPVRAQAGAVIVGACAIALGMTVLAYLVRSRRSTSLRLEEARTPLRIAQSQLPETARSANSKLPPHLAFQRIYADTYWIDSARSRHTYPSCSKPANGVVSPRAMRSAR